MKESIIENKPQQDKIENPKAKKEQMVEGVFRNWEIRGAPLSFSYRDDRKSAKKYTLEDGKKYILPLKVAKHINSCCYPVSEAELDKHGHYIGKKETMVRRFSFRRIDDLIDDVG